MTEKTSNQNFSVGERVSTHQRDYTMCCGAPCGQVPAHIVKFTMIGNICRVTLKTEIGFVVHRDVRDVHKI